MLVVRKEQIAALAQDTPKKFEERMLRYVQQYFLKQCEILGEVDTREVVRKSIIQANKYNFKSDHDVCIYINLVFMLGSGFDSDPMYPWAAALLHDEGIGNPSMRIDQLYNKAIACLKETAGDQNKYLLPVLLGIKNSSTDELLGQPNGDIENHLIERLGILYPQKCKAIGEENIRELIRHGIRTAESYAITNELGQRAFLFLMFMLGSDFHRDPLYPWAARILGDENKESGDVKAHRLVQEAREYLDNWLN